MELTSVKELYRQTEEYVDRKVSVGGWVRNNRDSKTFGFLVVNDGSFFETLQVVYGEKLSNFEEITKLNIGAAVIVTGTIVATPGAKQPFEIQADEVLIEGESAPDYPLQKKRHSFEYLRTISHLRPRTNTFQAVFRVRSLIAYAIHKFFQERNSRQRVSASSIFSGGSQWIATPSRSIFRNQVSCRFANWRIFISS